MDSRGMKVAIVHYWLVAMRGGERVVEALCELFPEADIFTHVCDRQALSEALRRHTIHTSFIDRLPWAKRLYPRYLPLMPLALESLDLQAYDLVISSESGPAKGIIPSPSACHICYCHSPMRYVWDLYPTYWREAGWLSRKLMPPVAHYLRTWDVASSARVGHFAANSRFVAERVRQYYRREATVIHPPVDVARFRPKTAGESGDHYLYAGQLVPNKGVELAIGACRRLGRPLKVVGEGPLLRRARALAGDGVEVLGWQPDAELEALYRSSRALLFPGVEDFGIVPLEAMASGTPVLAYGKGGALETVVPGQTGLLFDEPTEDSLAACMERFEEGPAPEPQALHEYASGFGGDRFRRQFGEFVAGVTR